MKKIVALVLLLTLALFLFSCGKEKETTVTRVGYLAGTTGLGLAKLITDSEESDSYTFTKYNSPAEIMAAVSNGSLDFAALPTNAFPAFRAGYPVQMAAINTLGVLYLLTNDETVSSLSDLSGKTVYVPENAPKLVLQYLLNLSGVENVTLSMEYDLDTLPNMIAAGTVSIALLPEPKVTVAQNLAKSSGAIVNAALDLSEIWDSLSDTSLVQGCMLVTEAFSTAHPGLVDRFLTDYEASVAFMSDSKNLTEAAAAAVSAGILPNSTVALAAIPRCHLTFRSGNTMMTDANAFFTALGITLPTGSAYYVAE